MTKLADTTRIISRFLTDQGALAEGRDIMQAADALDAAEKALASIPANVHREACPAGKDETVCCTCDNPEYPWAHNARAALAKLRGEA